MRLAPPPKLAPHWLRVLSLMGLLICACGRTEALIDVGGDVAPSRTHDAGPVRSDDDRASADAAPVAGDGSERVDASERVMDAAASAASGATMPAATFDAGADAAAARRADGSICPGVEEVNGSKCRTASDCKAGERCTVNWGNGCPKCRPAFKGCTPGPGACPLTSVCRKSLDYCACDNEPSFSCVRPCQVTLCASDQVCADDGLCKPGSCQAGYKCRMNQVCAPERGVVDEHGCAPAHCVLDAVRCPDGSVCSGSAVDGCRPIHCSEGYACPMNRVCEPTSSEPHGCARKRCGQDGECDCGACIEGLCRDQLFVCTPLPEP
jgi:hypothetical protein